MRLFISINLPPELHDHCRQLQKRFPSMKNVDEFHLTLQFLGDNIGEQFLPRLNGALKSIEFKPFEIKLGQPRRFPNEFEPKGVWIDCDGGKALKELADRIRKIMDKTGFRPDKPFVAHVTLGRYKKATANLLDSRLPFSVLLRQGYEGLRRINRGNDKKGENDDSETKSFVTDRFYLMQSHLTPEGPNYKILSEFPASV